MTQPLVPHRAIAERIRSLRVQHGWSAQRLADEMKAVGVEWDRSIVANFETGRRAGISVQEFLALAYVLSVAPIHLLVPIDAADDDEYYVVPAGKHGTEVKHVRAWIRGLNPVGLVDPRRYFSEVPAAEWRPPETVWSDSTIKSMSDAARAREQEKRDG